MVDAWIGEWISGRPAAVGLLNLWTTTTRKELFDVKPLSRRKRSQTASRYESRGSSRVPGMGGARQDSREGRRENPKKYRELIAIAVAHTTQCVYCIEVHTKNAKKAGATKEEVAESILLAAALRAGGAAAHGTLTMKFYDQG